MLSGPLFAQRRTAVRARWRDDAEVGEAAGRDSSPRGHHIGSSLVAHTFEDLVDLERAAEEARARYLAADTDPAVARQAWIEAAAAFQHAVTEHAEAEGAVRYEVEMAVKQAVRRPEPEPAES
jgi:hypothetical protein